MRRLWPEEPFAEAQEVSDYLKTKTRPGDYLFVWAHEPEIYFYTKCHPSSYESNAPFLYFGKIMRANPFQVLMYDLADKVPGYIVVDTRHLPAIKYFSSLESYLKAYEIDKKWDINRPGVKPFSLVLLRRKG